MIHLQHRFRRSRFLVCAGLVAVLVSGSLAFAFNRQISDYVLSSEGYSLVVDNPEVFGDGASPTVACRLRNLASSSVTVCGVSSACGCMEALNLPLVVRSHDVADLLLDISAASRRNGETSVQDIRIYVDRPSPPLVVRVTTRVGKYKAGSAVVE